MKQLPMLPSPFAPAPSAPRKGAIVYLGTYTLNHLQWHLQQVTETGQCHVFLKGAPLSRGRVYPSVEAAIDALDRGK